MAFNVEDGTGMTDSNAFASVEDVSDYLADRGMTAWAALSTANKEFAIIKATEYMSRSLPWMGLELRPYVQALGLPRLVYLQTPGAQVIFSLPVDVTLMFQPRIVGACARLAYEVGVNGVDLFARVSSKDLVKSVAAGSVRVDFDERGIQQAALGRPDFPWLTDMLAEYLDGGGTGLSRKIARA